MNRATALVVAAAALVAVGLLAVVMACGSEPPGEPEPGRPTPPSATPPPAGEASESPPATDDARAADDAPATDDGQEPPRATGQLRVPTAGWETDFSIASVDLSEFISGGPGKDGIPPIDEPSLESIADAGAWLDDRSPVIALELNGEARAYPLAILMWHEIVNETLGGTPIVVTFCPLCNTALVFEREVDGVLYDFGTTGNLRFSDLVMWDRQTESWWQQATGEAIVGVLTGTRLPFVPSQIISLSEFAAIHPDALVLSRDTGHRRDYGRNPYVGYDSVDQNPFLFTGVVDGRLAPMERVVAVKVGEETVAYPFSELAQIGAVHDVVGGEEIVVLWQAGVSSALDAALIDDGRDVGASGVFDPTLDGERLTFEASADGTIVDRQTGSTWSITGMAVDGELAGERLEPIGHGDHFWFAWAAFEPETRIWTADEVPDAGRGTLVDRVAGLPIQWVEVDVARFMGQDTGSLDAAHLRALVERSGVGPEKFRMVSGLAGDESRGPLWLTAFSAGSLSASRLEPLVRSAALPEQSVGPLASAVVLAGDFVVLVSSNDHAFHAAALADLAE